MANVVLGVFGGILAIQLFAAAAESTRARQITKPLLMPLLLLFYWLRAAEPAALVMLALVFSTMGDVLLLRPNKQGTFIAGLLSFLAAHVLYIVVFASNIARADGLPVWFYIIIVPYMLYCIGLFLALRPHLGPMKAPFVLYCLIISAMSLISLLRVPSFSGAGFYLPFIGSLLFMASDSILAIDTFRSKIPYGNMYIMATYVAAQVLIITGMIMS
ncbi:MAG: lysoplasmalogenase [Clostridia bacterium]|nr:lysoplasmalogenase [Clostridia bacterium]